jgi:hypothetical protein
MKRRQDTDQRKKSRPLLSRDFIYDLSTPSALPVFSHENANFVSKQRYMKRSGSADLTLHYGAESRG